MHPEISLGGGAEEVPFPPVCFTLCSEGLCWVLVTGDYFGAFSRLLYAVIKSKLLHFILPQFAHL